MTYIPKPGSKAEVALAALQTGAKSTAALADAMGLQSKQVHQYMATAIKAGVVEIEKVAGRSWFRLAGMQVPSFVEPPVASEPEPVQMCMWTDGDVDLFGVEMLERGDGVQFVRLTRDQVQQLVSLATGVTGI